MIDGVILAGGSARRFGSDKCAHPVEGVPMVERVVGATRPIVSRLFLSVAAPAASDLGRTDQSFYQLFDEIVHDDLPDGGPLAGMWSVSRKATAPWLLVVACDLPWITGESLETLRDAAVSHAAAIAVGEGGRLQPLCGCYSREALEPIAGRLGKGSLSVTGFVESLADVVTVRLPERQLSNINTVEDLVRPELLNDNDQIPYTP